MSLDQDDEKLEAYLRQFRPRQPRDLPEPRVLRWRRRTPALAAVAALIVVALWLRVWRSPRVEPPPLASEASDLARETSLGSLSRVVRNAPESIDSHLDRLSPRLLPDVQRSTGVLKALAKESDRKDIR
jgi:hypothetical protein